MSVMGFQKNVDGVGYIQFYFEFLELFLTLLSPQGQGILWFCPWVEILRAFYVVVPGWRSWVSYLRHLCGIKCLFTSSHQMAPFVHVQYN